VIERGAGIVQRNEIVANAGVVLELGIDRHELALSMSRLRHRTSAALLVAGLAKSLLRKCSAR
jgi:hypothetical protein